jgi:flagellin-specific chaperone FliS
MLAAVITFCYAAQVSAEPRYVPHEDPGALDDYVDKQALLLYYSDILTLIYQGDYDAAADLIDKLKYAHIPEEQRLLLEEYGDLIDGLQEVITSSSEFLDSASSLIAQYRLDEAGEQLDKAQSILTQMEALLLNIDGDTESVGDVLGVFESIPSSLLRLAYDALENSVGLIWDLETELSDLRELLQRTIETLRAKNLQPTELTIALSPDRAFVGDSVSVSGALSSQGESLSSRKITILMDGVVCGETATDKDGTFRYEITVPFKYVPIITLRALYTPATNPDLDQYLPAASATASLSVDFYQTELTLDVPSSVYVGMPFTISGEAGWEQDGGFEARTLRISLDGVLLDTISVSTGEFNLETSVDIGTTLGVHIVEASLVSNGRYAGASAQGSVTVIKAPPQVTLDVPGFVVLPGHVAISGTVTSELPIKGAEVRIDFVGKSVTTVVGDNGRFNASISVGMKWGLLGFYDLTASVFPAEPWNADVAVKGRVFALGIANLLTIALSLAITVTLGSIAYTHRRRRRKELQKGQAQPHVPAAGMEPATAEAVGPRSDMTGNKGGVLRAYAAAVQAIERRGLGKLEPYMTMREFLSAAAPALHSAEDSFSRLTSLAERALYSSHEVEDLEVTAAQQIAASISEVMQRGLS